MNSKFLSQALVLLLAATLAGCGGGGGGGGDTTQASAGAAPTPPGSNTQGAQIQTTYVLATAVAGTGSVVSATNNINCTTSSCTSNVAESTSVTLTATPVSGAAFVGWTGDCAGASSTCTVSMTGAKSVTATFTQMYALTAAVTGVGSVASSDGGINCATGSCSSSFAANTNVTLTATAGTGAGFAGWTGACTGTSTTCVVSMSAAKSVAARFTYALSTTVSGTGSVASVDNGINCSTATCTTNITGNANVTLTANAGSGTVFSGWTGACTGTSTTCTVAMSAVKAVTATFTTVSAGATCNIVRGTVGATPTFAASHPKVFLNHASTMACLRQMLTAQTPASLRFKAYVDSEVASPGSNWGFSYWWAAMMYQVTGTASYGNFAVTKLDAIVAGEEALIAAGNNPFVAGDSYLHVGEVVADVALVYDWCYSLMTPAQRTRWLNYMNQSIYNVWHPTLATWGGRAAPWSGWATTSPSNNYYYSFLRGTMMVGLATRGDNDPAAAGYISQFRTAKLQTELVPEFTRDLVGGGSREGTGYGSAQRTLFQLYDWWERTTGERIVTLTPHAQASAAWLAHSVVPTLDYLVSTGDHARESTAALFDYDRQYLLTLASLFPTDRMSGMSKVLLDGSTVATSIYNFQSWVDYVYQPQALPAAVITDLSSTYWGAGTGQLMMRSAWGDRTAAYADFICGPYTESHAHMDQGSFQIYRGGWLAPTSSIYTKSGVQQGPEFNNLVRFALNGTPIYQVNSTTNSCVMKAVADNDYYAYGYADATRAYNGNAAVAKSEREFIFIKPSTFIVFDRVVGASGTSRTWTLNLPNAPVVSGDRLTYTGTGSNKLDVYRLAPTGLAYQVNTVAPITDFNNTNAKRVDVVDTAGTQSNFLHVMGTNNSVTSVTRSDATGQIGAVIALADGRTVTVRFSTATPGASVSSGTIDIRQTSGTVQVSGNLPTGVTTPPLYRN